MEKTLQQIINRVNCLREKKQDRILIAIDGNSTSGKSTLAAQLQDLWDCNVFHMDDFFLRPEQRTPERLEQPGGNVDYERFRQEVLVPLETGAPFSYRPYDCSTGTLGSPVAVTPKTINVIEGSYSHHPYFADAYDLRIFLKVSPEVQRQRIAQRPAFLHKRFLEEWIPMENRYHEAFGIAGASDIQAFPKDNL